MSQVKTDIENGIGLDDKEIQELVDMLYEDHYHKVEVCEWFGITPQKMKTYLKIADRKGIKPSQTMGKIDGKNYSNLDLFELKHYESDEIIFNRIK